MEELVALKEIGDSIGVFKPGQRFYDPDPIHADQLVRQGLARRFDGEWDGLKWKGATVVVFAAGPSLTEKQCEQVRAWRDVDPSKRKAITINTSFKITPWADVLYACDSRWWIIYYQEVQRIFKGQLWTQDHAWNSRFNGALRVIKSQTGLGLNKQIGVINQGGNSGYQAIGLAYHAGVRKIVLLGYDMNERKGKHWHGPHPKELTQRTNYAAWIHSFQKLASDLSKEGVEVINATPGTSLKCFTEMDLTEALQ